MKYIVGLFAVFAATAALLLGLIGANAQVSAQSSDLNNFKILSYDINYELTRDEEKHSVLKTTEKIVANFHSYNKNHGIEREIPHKYQGHSTNLEIASVTDGSGNELNYSANKSGDITTLRIGDSDKYVNGKQAYEITYTQRDVTHYFQSNDKDEWYWDTNGTGWAVSIGSLNVTMKISDDIMASYVDRRCYVGEAGRSDQCEFTTNEDGSLSASATNLRAGENITVAFGFEPGTFAQYEPTLWDYFANIWATLAIVTAVIGAVILVILTIVYYLRLNRSMELGTIVPEYIPPKDASVMIASQVVATSGSVFSAQLIDFAVRHFIEIIETKPSARFTRAEYDIKIISDLSPLRAEEMEILTDMFGHQPKVGERLALSNLTGDYKYFTRTSDNRIKLLALVLNEYKIREKSSEKSKLFKNWAIVLLVMAILTLSPAFLFVSLFALGYSFTLKPLTDKGLALKRYVKGLDRYIKAAEVERIKMLQGPDTAQKIGENIDASNSGQLVKLYERVLPYAILLGHEKKWGQQLGHLYEQSHQNPSWYSGDNTTGFNAVAFSAAIHSFSTSATYSSGVIDSSTSGGSGGGGSSGGGGGGGGGGGW